MSNIIMNATMDSFVSATGGSEAAIKQAAREAIGIYVTTSATNVLTLSGAGSVTLSSGGAYTATIPATGTVVMNDNAATLTNKVLTEATITTSLRPTSNDGAALGSATYKFSDLFLASGAVINFDNGNAAITHSSGNISITGNFIATSINDLDISTSVPGTTVLIENNLVFGGVGSFTITNTGNTSTVLTSGTMATLAGSETLTNKVLTAATITTSLVPTNDDGAALGSAAKKFSDLFLASGAVLNFDNGNVAVTHSSGILTIGTGDLRMGTSGSNAASVVTVGGTQTLTAKTLTSPTITTPAITNPTVTSGGEFGGTPNFTSGLTSEGDIQADAGADIVVADPSGKIGYQTGSGGSVVQITSKSTSVTINKPSGKITMQGAALAAATDVSFTVDNSVCDTSCNVVINVIGGATVGAYQVTAHTIGIGSFGVTLRNMTGGSLSESVALQFCIIKGAIT